MLLPKGSARLDGTRTWTTYIIRIIGCLSVIYEGRVCVVNVKEEEEEDLGVGWTGLVQLLLELLKTYPLLLLHPLLLTEELRVKPCKHSLLCHPLHAAHTHTHTHPHE